MTWPRSTSSRPDVPTDERSRPGAEVPRLRDSGKEPDPDQYASGPNLGRASEPLAAGFPDVLHRYQVLSLRTQQELQPYLTGWERLAARAAEPNPFYEPWMLLPAMECYGAGQDLQILLVLAGTQDSQNVVAVVPLMTQGRFRGLPLRSTSVWQHPQCYLCTPLIERGLEHKCWAAILEWMAQDLGTGHILEVADLAADGPVFRALSEVLNARRQRVHVSGLYTRSLLCVGADADAYLATYVKRADWSNCQRKRRRLDEVGLVKSLQLGPGDDLDEWMSTFLALEQSGWKGRTRSAINCRGVDRTYYSQVAREAFNRGRLIATSLLLEGKTVAAQLDISAGVGAFSIKIAYDERYARFSPGVLLSVDIVRRLHREQTVRWLDSCTAPGDHPTRHLWGQWRLLSSLVLPIGGRGSDLLVSLIPAAKAILGRR